MISARVVLGAAVAFCPFALACGNSPERERLDFERMRLQQRYDLYGKSGVFANHQSMQAPPPGTVTRESALDTGAIGTGMSGGQLVASVPFSLTPAQLVRGERKFTIYCAVCHGDGGFGGSIVAENMGPPRPPSLRSDSMVARPDGYIFDVATHGKGRMPAYAVELTPTERWAVIGYIRILQQSRTLTPAQHTDSLRAAAIRSADSLAGQTSRAGGSTP
jgi:mono/diheme cytochrome c family protein